jgi:magnesium transporter
VDRVVRAERGAVADTFGLHELAVEDAVHAHQRPKLDRYEDMLFMVVKTVRYVEHESPTTANEIVESGEIMAFLCEDFIVTVRHGDHSGLGELRRELEAEPRRLRAGPSVVLPAIADRAVDSYLSVSEAFESDIDVIEAKCVRARQPGRARADVPGEAGDPRAAAGGHAAGHAIAPPRGGVHPLVPEQVRSYFRDVDDHLATVTERVTNFDELLTTLVDATLAKVSLQQNSDMRKITAWVAIIAVPTMGVGVYGMNFDHMPELHWTYGYPIVMTVILVVCVILHRVFTRNRWAVTRRREGRMPMSLLTRSWFWVLLFVLGWLTLVVVQISLGMDEAPCGGGKP